MPDTVTSLRTRLQRFGRSIIKPRPILPPTSGDECDFVAHVCVVLPEPTVIPPQPGDVIAITEGSECVTPEEAASSPMIGYFINIGLRSEPNDVKHRLERIVQDGAIHWGETEWSITMMDTSIDRVIRKQIKGIGEHGVWYVGGRFYFSEW
jgi:hypothetical protein